MSKETMQRNKYAALALMLAIVMALSMIAPTFSVVASTSDSTDTTAGVRITDEDGGIGSGLSWLVVFRSNWPALAGGSNDIVYQRIIPNGQSFGQGALSAIGSGLVPPPGGWRFAGWSTSPNGPVNFFHNTAVTSNLALYAIWVRVQGPPPWNGGEPGETPTIILPEIQPPVAGIFTTYHNAFLIGFPDDTVRPQGSLTRAQAATVLFRLLSDEFRAEVWSKQNDFTDVMPEHWFNNAISTMASAGVIRGTPDGTFRPNDAITRAEFAALIARFFTEFTPRENAFVDIEGNWAEDYINLVAQFGWIQGTGDRMFNPNELLARSEAAAIVNRMLLRLPAGTDALLPTRNMWPDMPNMNTWYYLYMQEASHSTLFDRLEDGRLVWVSILPHLYWQILERPESTPEMVAVARASQIAQANG